MYFETYMTTTAKVTKTKKVTIIIRGKKLRSGRDTCKTRQKNRKKTTFSRLPEKLDKSTLLSLSMFPLYHSFVFWIASRRS